MKKRNREVEVFGLSAVDLFASALGAVLLITVVLMPSYLKKQATASEREQQEARLEQCRQATAELPELRRQASEAQRLQAENEALRARVAAARSEAQLQDRLQSCEEMLRQTFLIVTIQWPTNAHDVDLHVTDPQGREFSFRKSNMSGRDYPDSPATLSLDNQRGPGLEIWQHPRATPGTYRIAYTFYDANGNPGPTSVSGNVFSRNGRTEIWPVNLSQIAVKVPVATVTVEPTGAIRVN